MLGLLFAELKRFLEGEGVGAVWHESVAAAGLGASTSFPSHKDDDEAFHALVDAAAVRLQTPPRTLLGRLGERLGRDVFLAHQDAIDPAWSVVELLERGPLAIRAVASHGDSDDAPPRFATRVEHRDAIVLDWYAPKRLCPVAKGMVRGIARLMGTDVQTIESFCMDGGDDHCEMTFRTLEASAAAA